LPTRQDIELRRRVQAELDWEPDLKEHEIGLSVKDGVVTLWGRVSDDGHRRIAEDAAKRVTGIDVIVDRLSVGAMGHGDSWEEQLAHAVRQHLRWHLKVPHGSVKATVVQGWITLEGEVSVLQHRIEAERSVRQMPGVRGVTNLIREAPQQVGQTAGKHGGVSSQ
jgi:osmotically-inducible protein OsmY